MCSCGFKSKIFNDFLSKVYIKCVHTKSIELSGNDFGGWNWVLFFAEESIWSTLRNKNGVVIPLITELDEPFRGFYGSFKLYVEKLIPIRNLFPWKITEFERYDIVWSY